VAGLRGGHYEFFGKAAGNVDFHKKITTDTNNKKKTTKVRRAPGGFLLFPSRVVFYLLSAG
jgi:hypothetical protein